MPNLKLVDLYLHSAMRYTIQAQNFYFSQRKEKLWEPGEKSKWTINCSTRWQLQRVWYSDARRKLLISNFRRAVYVLSFGWFPDVWIIRPCFGTLCQFHLHSSFKLALKMENSVPKRRHINFRRRGITQKKECNNKRAVNSARGTDRLARHQP